MPLKHGKSRAAIAIALDVARKSRRANGGAVRAFHGPVNAHGPGRTDRYPLQAASGSYVIPADIVSSLGEGNTAAGNEVIRRMFFRGGMLTKSNNSARISGTVPVIVAGGEYIIPPETVEEIGDGDLDRGHSLLDDFVKSHRKRTVKQLKSLPGPVKN